jgi:cardiolipin synthase A/B
MKDEFPPRTTWRRLAPRLVDPFPIVGGNALVAIEHGPSFFDRMLDAIRAATATVDVEMYLWDDDAMGRNFVEALHQATGRGCRVRILADAHGALAVLGRLDAIEGADVRFYNPFKMPFLRRYVHRTHKKMLVCDGALAFTGGAGFSLHWSSGGVGRRREDPWHDRMFEVRGPIVRQFERVFESDFHRWRSRRDVLRPAPREPEVEVAAPGASQLRVLRGWPDARDFRSELLARIRDAKERVWLGSPYFIPPPSLLTTLRAALRRGVKLELVLPSGNWAHPLLWHASRRHYGFFLRRGARIHEYAGGFYHAKLAVVDGDVALTGSSNLDYWSWNRNAEIDFLASDAPTVDLLARCFDDDRARSREVTLREIGMRGEWTRFKEMTAGWIEDWL